MASTNELSRSINNTFMNGRVEGCVIKVEDNKAHIMAMDVSAALFVNTVAEIKMSDCELGIGNLNLFTKYLNLLKDVDVDIKLKDERLTITSGKDNKVEYLLSEPDLIPNFDEEWPDSLFADELENYENSMKLTQEKISEFLKFFSLFTPNNVAFEVDKKGKVLLKGGADTETKFQVLLGKIKGVEACTIKVYGDNISAVLSSLDYDANPELLLNDSDAFIVKTDHTGWIVSSTSADED